MTFSDLSLHPALIKALHDSSYTQATEIQQKTIPLILAKHDVMARAQTGTGKTAAFALPILQNIIENERSALTPTVLVLIPTRELAQQVYKNFCDYNQYSDVKIAVAYGGVSTKQQINQIRDGIDIIISTPGRLLDLIHTDSIDLKKIDTLVFDEADRILDLGFKDEVNRILQNIPKIKQTLLFSATFDDQLYKLSKSLLVNPTKVEVNETNVVAENIEQIIYAVDSDRKRELTSFLIGSKNWRQVLVFTRTKQCADDLAKEMSKDGIKSLAIHGDKSQGARDKALLQFKEGKIRALVATDVAARGIDIKELSHVINYELPYNAEDYIHRIGRTARAGNSGIAISLLSKKEEWLLTAIEELLDKKLLQQWYPGYEPDLTKIDKSESKTISKKNARKKAFSSNNNSKNNRRKRR